MNVICDAQPVLQQQFDSLMQRAAQLAAEEEQRQQQQQQGADAAPTEAAAQAAEEAALQAEVERVSCVLCGSPKYCGSVLQLPGTPYRLAHSFSVSLQCCMAAMLHVAPNSQAGRRTRPSHGNSP